MRPYETSSFVSLEEKTVASTLRSEMGIKFRVSKALESKK